MKIKTALVILVVLVLGAILVVENKPPAIKSLVGQPAPPFAVEKWLTPEPDHAGKFVVIDFWATWCPACVESIPRLNELQKKFTNQLVVIGVSDESEETIRAFKRATLEYPNATDPQQRMIRALDAPTFPLPYTFIIDPHGILRYQDCPTVPGHELTDDLLTNLFAKYSN